MYWNIHCLSQNSKFSLQWQRKRSYLLRWVMKLVETVLFFWGPFLLVSEFHLLIPNAFFKFLYMSFSLKLPKKCKYFMISFVELIWTSVWTHSSSFSDNLFSPKAELWQSSSGVMWTIWFIKTDQRNIGEWVGMLFFWKCASKSPFGILRTPPPFFPTWTICTWIYMFFFSKLHLAFSFSCHHFLAFSAFSFNSEFFLYRLPVIWPFSKSLL